MLFFYTGDNITVYCLNAPNRNEFLRRLKTSFSIVKEVPSSCVRKLFPNIAWAPGDRHSLPVNKFDEAYYEWSAWDDGNYY